MFSPTKAVAGTIAGARTMGAALADDLVHLPRGLRAGGDPDEWDPEYIERTLPLMRGLFSNYFRGEVRGLENIPADGPSLLVGNHSGGLYIADTFVFGIEFYARFGPRRRFHQLAHDLAVRSPVGGLLRRYGTLAASHENAHRGFERGAPVLVYPGGDYETFRPTWQSSEIDFGGRNGFVKLALSEGVPIVPVVSIGGQETALFLTRGESLARALRLDRLRVKVLPVSLGPPLGVNLLDLPGRIPLPAKITVEVLPPLRASGHPGSSTDREQIYEQVTGEMQAALDRLDDERSVPVVG